MGLSRNKVAVPEGAAGSPPFYGVFRTPGFGVRRVPPSSMMVVDVVGVAGVEEIMGFPGRFWSGGVVWVCFWAPGPPPHRRGVAWSRPSSWPSRLVPVGRVRWRAWWFENWIVDASNRKTCLFSVALSRFRQTPFGVWFEIDRFVIILQCDDLSSGDLAGVIRWPCALFGVWCRR